MTRARFKTVSPRETLYAALGVSPGASYEELRAAYRKLAWENHDKGNYHAGFEKITEAWSVLSSSLARQLYDAQLKLDGQNCSVCEGRGIRWARPEFKKCESCEGSGRL